MSNKLTAEQIELQSFIEAENAAWVAECEANGSTFYTTTASDADFWAYYGITTVAQYKRYTLEQSFWDLYKDVHGYRPRHLDLSDCSDEQLECMYDDLIEHSKIREIVSVA